ncbi:putative damage-inducible protein DinB [Chitinophaga sp. W3I9]|uniref:DinB family protein n=1 Tax=unclassified Chitinophaga TaxID=2619133 RepID=UPI003D2501AD
MDKKYFITLADYNVWADNIAMGWLNQIDEEQWNLPVISSFSSIQQTAIHIASAEKIWVDFWRKVPDPVYLSAGFKGTKNDLIEIWRKASAGLRNFIEEYPEENYLQKISFIKPNGEEDQMEFVQTFPHIINHSTFHRGQLVTMLRQAGFTKLSSTDLFTFYRLHC